MRIRFASIIVTYRCNARCHMCNTWRYPSRRQDEVDLNVYERLPRMDSVNVTGGEPFMREDLSDVIAVLKRRARRVVISSNGYYTDRIVELFRRHPDVGLRVSLEGLPKANDELRGLADGFDRGIRTLTELAHLGIKDIGFGITVSDRNARDLIELYHLAKMMRVEFATAAVHNSFYFHKYDNRFERPDEVVEEIRRLIQELLRSRRVKDWFRAYFNYGLVEYVRGRPRLLPCEMGRDSFFLDPGGAVLPCNVLEAQMGDLKNQTFEEIWSSARAEEVRASVRDCSRNCWMMGSVGQQMLKTPLMPALWIARHRLLRRTVVA